MNLIIFQKVPILAFFCLFYEVVLSWIRYRTLFCVTLIPLIFADHFRKFCFVFPTKVRNVIIFHLRLSAFSARTNHAFSGLPPKVYGREKLEKGTLHKTIILNNSNRRRQANL